MITVYYFGGKLKDGQWRGGTRSDGTRSCTWEGPAKETLKECYSSKYLESTKPVVQGLKTWEHLCSCLLVSLLAKSGGCVQAKRDWSVRVVERVAEGDTVFIFSWNNALVLPAKIKLEGYPSARNELQHALGGLSCPDKMYSSTREQSERFLFFQQVVGSTERWEYFSEAFSQPSDKLSKLSFYNLENKSWNAPLSSSGKIRSSTVCEMKLRPALVSNVCFCLHLLDSGLVEAVEICSVNTVSIWTQ